MAGAIKGITIEFDGNTTKLSAAMSKIQKEANAVDKSLKSVNNALKFNPGNTELLAQKQSLLRQKIEATNSSLKELKNAQAQLDAKGVDKSSAEYQKLRQQIITTESKLKHFNAEMIKVNAALSPLGRAGTKMTALGKSATSLGKKMKGTSTAAAVLATGIGALAYKAGAAADDLNTLSHQYGINTKDLQNYQSTADLVDVSVETLAKTHVKLKKNMLSASQSATGTTAKAFEKLGIKVTDSNGELRDGNTVYDECINKLAGMKNETERDAYAMQIFGKSAADLNPMLEGGAEQYKNFTDLMAKNNLDPISQSALDKANDFNDAIDTIKATASRALQIIGTKLAGYLAPKMQELSEGFAKIAGWVANLSGKTLAVIGTIASAVAVIAPLLLIFGKLSTGIGGALRSLSILVTKIPMLGKALAALTANPILLIVAALAALTIAIGASGVSADELTAKITNVVNGIASALPGIITAVTSTITTVATLLPTLIPVLVNGFVTLLTALVQALPVILPALVNGFTQLILAIVNLLPTMVPQLLNAAVILFTALVKAIPLIAAAVITALPQIVKAFKSGLQAALPKIWDSIKTTAIGKFISMVASIGRAFAKVVDAIAKPFEKAYSLVKRAIDKIKAVVEAVKLKLDIKIPHIKVSGGKAPFGIAGKGKLPSFNVDWYKNGGIFTSATLLGDKGVGEAGAEAALPLSNLWDQMDKQNNKLIATLSATTAIDYDKLAAALSSSIGGMTVAVDGRPFGKLARKGMVGAI